ncbi:hypothetical protein KJC03_12800 [Mammaliicoccus sciuri]|uniref:hypothetical protein n=1 Tax=Mammaliicoccus sciuri TaxID=1296 RepID=UPI000D1E0F83|nr:hypothetical protein [Mammaliicoccus sciuri]MCE5041965.1 hypothetical protein [Mammaliicoccus sciuri]PTJ62208.1 hypothetical protein BUZ97_12185 [Mammaliicoccus sciuri]
MDNILLNPYKLLDSNRKKKIAIIIVSLFWIITQILVTVNFFNSDVLKQMTDKIEDIPYWLFVAIMVFIQLFFTFINIILITIIFKVVTMFLLKKLPLLKILYIFYISQIPIFIGMILNSIFVSIDNNSEIILSITSLGFPASFLTSNNIVLSILNSLDLFDLWATIIISNGIHVYNNRDSFKKIFITIFLTYFLVKIFTNLLF